MRRRHGASVRDCGVQTVPWSALEVSRVDATAIVTCLDRAGRSAAAGAARDALARVGPVRLGHGLGGDGAGAPGRCGAAAGGAGAEYRAALAALAGQPGRERADAVAAAAAEVVGPLGRHRGGAGLRSYALPRRVD